MGTFQLRRGTASAWTASNPVLELGEPGIETDTSKIKVGDGTSVWTALSYISEWGGSGGGGSSTPPAQTELGSGGTLGATVTLPVPNEGDLQVGILTADLVITPPLPPSSGDTVSFKVKLVQNGTGGWTWGFATSAKFPAGIQIPLTAAGAENWMEFVWDWDTNSYAIFPATAGATVVTCTALDVLGGDGGRFMGFQSTGVAPTQSSPQTNDFWLDTSGTPSFWIWSGTAWENFGGAGGGGSVTITSPDSSITVAGSSSAPTLEIAASYLTIPSPAGFARASYSAAVSKWLAVSDRYADVIEHFGVTPGSTTDQSTALNNATETLGKAGYIGFLPPSAGVPVQVKNPLAIGDGNTTTVATWTGGLRGGMPVTNTNSDYTLVGSSQILWTGADGAAALMEINGPLQGLELKNLVLDGGATSATHGPLWCLVDSSGHYSDIDFVIFRGCQGGIQITTCGAKTVGVNNVGGNTSDEHFGNVSVQFCGSSASTTPQTAFAGLMFTEGSGTSGNGNSCYNVFDHLTIAYNGTNGNYAYGVIFQACDSNRIRNLHIGYNTSHLLTAPIAYVYRSTSNFWPSDCLVDILECGGHPTGAVQVGSTASSSIGRNRVERINMVNGYTPDPLLSNTAWGSPNIHGVATLAAGHATINVPTAITGQGMIVKTSVQTFGGTPGAFVQGAVSAAATVSIHSYESDGVTVQALDTSGVYWELLNG